MNQITKTGLNLMQKAKLDYIVIKLLNKPSINNLMLKYCWQHKGYKHFYDNYLIWREILEKNKINLAEKKILEVGSGASIGLGYFFLTQGYQSWLASDFFQDLSGDRQAIKREMKLVKKIIDNYDKNVLSWLKITADNIIFSQKLNFRRLNLVELKIELKKSFDLILSSNVLEHLEEELIERAIENLSLYLEEGALMIHEIALGDHINVANPHGFLKYDKESWNKLTRGTIFYTNRLRLKDYLDIFSKHGLRVRWLETITNPLTNKIKVNEYFKKYTTQELEIIRVFIILEKIS